MLSPAATPITHGPMPWLVTPLHELVVTRTRCTCQDQIATWRFVADTGTNQHDLTSTSHKTVFGRCTLHGTPLNVDNRFRLPLHLPSSVLPVLRCQTHLPTSPPCCHRCLLRPAREVSIETLCLLACLLKSRLASSRLSGTRSQLPTVPPVQGPSASQPHHPSSHPILSPPRPIVSILRTLFLTLPRGLFYFAAVQASTNLLAGWLPSSNQP